MRKNKKLAVSAAALAAAAAVLAGGTFAWQSISQTALNEASDIVNPGGRLHNDLHEINAKETDSNVYVENFTDPGSGEVIFARVRLAEYFEIVMNYGTPAEKVEVITGSKTPKDGVTDVTAEVATSKDQFDYTYTVHRFDEVNAADAFWDWTAGSGDSETIYYLPTFNKNKDSLAADLNGLYVDRVGGISSRGSEQYEAYEEIGADSTKTAWAVYDGDANSVDELKDLSINELHALIADQTGAEALADHIVQAQEEHQAKELGTTRGLISMAEWTALTSEKDRYWVYDTDGWIYWSSPIEAGETTGLLLDSFTLKETMDDTWYYAVQVTGQFITADDLGEKGLDDGSGVLTGGTGFYADGETVSDEALGLLKEIGVETGEEPAEPEEPEAPAESKLKLSNFGSTQDFGTSKGMYSFDLSYDNTSLDQEAIDKISLNIYETQTNNLIKTVSSDKITYGEYSNYAHCFYADLLGAGLTFADGNNVFDIEAVYTTEGGTEKAKTTVTVCKEIMTLTETEESNLSLILGHSPFLRIQGISDLTSKEITFALEVATRGEYIAATGGKSDEKSTETCDCYEYTSDAIEGASQFYVDRTAGEVRFSPSYYGSYKISLTIEGTTYTGVLSVGLPLGPM